MATTVLAIAAVAGVVAAGVGAYYSYQASEAQANAINFQRRQTRIQEKQARDAAAAAADLAHERHVRIMAAQRAALGASGVSTTEGSSLVLQMDSAVEAALEEERIRAAGETQAAGFESQAKLFRAQRNDTRTAGYYTAGTTLLGGVSRAGYSYYNSRTQSTAA